MNLKYIVSRVLKKMRGSAILNSNIDCKSKVESGSTVINSSFDRHSFCGYDCLFNNCKVGAFTSIASNVKVGGSTHPMEYVSMSPVFLSHRDSVKTKLATHVYSNIPKTIIGNDVWIGEGVHVKSGVTIGSGAVIGMGSVVTKDVPDYAIFCGNPARLVRYRFNDDIRRRLVASEWWAMTDEELTSLGGVITDPERFLEVVESK
jgi:acetyltransferase-like isoleucine patch superfamily enzyme